MISFSVPTHWKFWKKVEFIWLNWYRNSHYRILSKLKKDYSLSIAHHLKWKKIKTPIQITYIFRPSRWWQDMLNAVSVADKFIQDSLTENWVIEDDNYKFVPLVISLCWEKDFEWKIEVYIEEIDQYIPEYIRKTLKIS